MKFLLRSAAVLLLFHHLSFGQGAIQNQLDTFVGKTGAVPTIDKATSSISFLRFPAGSALRIEGGTPQEKAVNFMAQNAGMFAITTDQDVYRVKESKRDNYGMEHVALQQYFNGVPVFDGVMKFHFNKDLALSSMNGNVIAINKLNTLPSVKKEIAEAVALKLVESQKTRDFKHTPKAPLKVVKNTLYVFQKGLAQGYNGEKHLVYEIEVRNDDTVREFLYIDAHTNTLVEQFAGMHEALDRKLYTYPPGSTRNTQPTLSWSEGNIFPGALDIWQQSEVESAGQIYNLIKNAFKYRSYDGADAPMITTHNNPSINCPNANWNGVTANYCVGIATDDVVAHEWGHAYTEHTSGLIYAWQAGALNEAYSDIWGETVDLLNNYFDTGEGAAMRPAAGGDCPAMATTSRWKLGEQATATGGALRDMYNPNCYGDPGRVLDPMYYCVNSQPANTNDYGGVHINSGVINHSYALLVDGGVYNGQTITGIGLTKAAHIYWYAQANFMTKTTDFAAQADILETSGLALLGINLPVLSTGVIDSGLSGQVITAADLAELHKVLLAVEMRAETNCVRTPMLQPVAAICAGGSEGEALFFYNFNGGLGDWTVSNSDITSSWFPRNWVLNSHAPGGRSGNVVSAVNYAGGDCAASNQKGIMNLLSPVMTIPHDAPTELSMAFDHYVSIEPGYDGGNIKYRIGTGAWTLVPASAFTANGYNRVLVTAAAGNTNPLAGQSAYSGSDMGSVSGSWGQSRINLTALGLGPGQTIQFRWDMGTDGCGGYDGWYIDDVRIYSCAVPSVQFVTTTTTVNEGEAINAGVAPADCLPYIEKVIQVKINRAPSSPVTVTMNPPTGTATLGITADYSFTPASFTLKAGALIQNVTVRVYNDAYVEGSETAVLSYTLSGGYGIREITNQTHTITIQDDDLLPGTVTVDLLNANFNDLAIPAGWSSGNSYPAEWAVARGLNPNEVFLDPNVPEGQPFLYANSDAYGQEERTWSIETSPFNTVGMKSLNLSFLEAFRVYAGTRDFDETAKVDVWDGTAWHNLLTHTEASGSSGAFGAAKTQSIAIPEAYANAAMKLRFVYTADWDYWWALDNIKVTGQVFSKIATAISTMPDEQYLGPLVTAYFYDPVTKNLMAKIENLTTFDYGCTQVEVDRAGTGSDKWTASYTISKKTFKVIPSNPNPGGEYRITLFYTDSELGAYKGSIVSMGKTDEGVMGSKDAGVFAEVQASTVFGTDWAYTARFTSGFSGFGLSNAVPGGSLPVKLVKFEGKHNTEGNLLKWETTSEVNSEYFTVERATDLKNFSGIGKITSNGNSAVTNSYSFIDTKYGKGLNYYRLKSVDLDGSFAYSKIIAVEAANAREVRLFPNPVQAVLNIELPDAGSVHVKIINASGQVVMEQDQVKTTRGIATQDVSELGTGLYQVIVSNENMDYHFRVIKL